MQRKLIFQLTNVLHLTSLWKWVVFWNSQMAYFRKSLHKKDQDHVLRARETEHPTQTLVFAKTAGQHNLVEVILFSQWGPQGNSPLCLFINYFHGTEEDKIWKVQFLRVLSHDLLWEIKIYKLKRSRPKLPIFCYLWSIKLLPNRSTPGDIQ